MTKFKMLLMSSAAPAFFLISGAAIAQQTPPAEESAGDEIVVTGTNIRGARINEALPVTIIGEADLASIGGIDGEDLIRSLPSQGAVNFRDDNTDTINDARRCFYQPSLHRIVRHTRAVEWPPRCSPSGHAG